MKMYMTRLYIGLNDRYTKRQEIPTERARMIVLDTLIDHGIRGCTILPARGVWQYEDDTLTDENTFVVEIMLEIECDFMLITDALKRELNQESIGVSRAVVDIEWR